MGLAMLRLVTVLTLFIALGIAWGTLTPPGASGAPLPLTDKQIHALAFALLTLPAAMTSPRFALWLAPVLFAYGGAIELIQPFVGRGAEWGDLLADGIGLLVGLGLGWGLSQLGMRRARNNTR